MNDATLRLLLGILAVICFWLGYNLMTDPLPRRRWLRYLPVVFWLLGVALGVFAWMGLPPWHVTPNGPHCPYQC